MHMYNRQLHPLEVNEKTGEPFLRLQQHHNIILTPPRLEDVTTSVRYMNDLRVNEWLGGVPYPYSLEDGKQFFSHIKQDSDEALQQLEDAKDDETLIFAQCPVRVIREVKEDGTDILIGDIGVMRCTNGELMGPNGVDWENKGKLEEENNKIPFGDPNILWSLGYFMAPSHHGQGIMSDAVGTVLRQWAVPRMGVRWMWGSAFTGNGGSVRVFLKNGFAEIGLYEDHAQVKGKRRGLHLLQWKYVTSV